MPVIWRWASGPNDPVVISKDWQEVMTIMQDKGYGIRPEIGKAIELTDAQFEQLKRDIGNGGSH